MAALILTAILIGMHFLTEAQKEIVKVAKYNWLSVTDLYGRLLGQNAPGQNVADKMFPNKMPPDTKSLNKN